MTDSNLAYRVVDWDLLYETRGSRRRGGTLARVTISTGLDGLTTRRILSHPQGAAIYGVWIVFLQIAAKCPRRGALVERGVPLTADDLALLTSLPAELCALALEVLSSPRVALLEQVPLEVAQTPVTVEPPTSANRRTPAISQPAPATPTPPDPDTQGSVKLAKNPYTGLPLPTLEQLIENPQLIEKLKPPPWRPPQSGPLPRPPIPSSAG